MKKVLCLMLCVLMLLPSFTALAYTKEAGAYADTWACNVYIEGKAENFNGQPVTVLLMNGDEVGYISELETDDVGYYKTKFKFNGNINDYTVKVRDAETASDLTDTLNKAFAKHDVYCMDIELKNAENDVINYIEEGDLVDVVVDIDNKYGDNANVSILIAAYDENNKLLATDSKSLAVGFGDMDVRKTVDFSGFKLPAGTVKAKAFAWQDTIDLLPLAKQDEKVDLDIPTKFVNENPEDTKVIGLVGASTVHAGQYAAFVYQYYATRYPGSNIVIINKGAAGDEAAGILNRMHWDIFNEDDPLGYGACDEIAIMVGANDLRYYKYAVHGKLADDEYFTYYPEMQKWLDTCLENYENIIKWCQENGKGVMLTPMTLYDESDKFVSTLREDHKLVYGTNYLFGQLAKNLKEMAAKYNIPFIDTYTSSNEYTLKIREAHPEATTVITQTDGLHHNGLGGYLVGYLLVRGQETDEIVAAVEIDALSQSSKTDGATVTGLDASSTSVSYTYLADALPLYAKADGYVWAEDYGVDITNTMNKEIIKVTGLESGTYSLIMDGLVVGEFDESDLEAGVNIATLENNPGQIQAKGIHENYYNKKRSNENALRTIFNEEHRMRNKVETNDKIDHNDERYKSYTADDWINLCNELVSRNLATSNAAIYESYKRQQDTYVQAVRECIEGMATDSIPTEHSVVIEKIQ